MAGRLIEGFVGAMSQTAATVERKVGRDHTGRWTPIGDGYALALAWSKAPADQLLSHPAVARFRKELQDVPLKKGDDLICVRGRRLDPTVESWMQMGPPPNSPEGRYSAPSDDVLYLCDSARGVFAELDPNAEEKLFLQDYKLPTNSLHVGDFSSPAISDFIKGVFDAAEEEGRQDRSSSCPFSQVVARLIIEAGFDCIMVPGVRGSGGNTYTNIVAFKVGKRWKSWSTQRAGFRCKLRGEVT